jgi:Flp pilus assembly pilin Flp
MKFINSIRSLALVRDTRGLSTVEYVIILCLVAVMAIGTWRNFGNAITSRIGSATDEVNGLTSE